MQCSEKIVDYLLQKGADPNASRNNNQISPLFDAISAGKKKTQLRRVELLLNGGANVRCLSEDRNNVLQWLVRFDESLELATFLIQAGADINYGDESWHESPLSAAVYKSRADLAEVLLAAGASPDVRISASHNDPIRRGKTAREIALASKNQAIRKLFA